MAEKTIKAGVMVRFEFDTKFPAYGTIINVEGDQANVNFRNPDTGEYETTKKNIEDLTVIGRP